MSSQAEERKRSVKGQTEEAEPIPLAKGIAQQQSMLCWRLPRSARTLAGMDEPLPSVPALRSSPLPHASLPRRPAGRVAYASVITAEEVDWSCRAGSPESRREKLRLANATGWTQSRRKRFWWMALLESCGWMEFARTAESAWRQLTCACKKERGCRFGVARRGIARCFVDEKEDGSSDELSSTTGEGALDPGRVRYLRQYGELGAFGCILWLVQWFLQATRMQESGAGQAFCIPDRVVQNRSTVHSNRPPTTCYHANVGHRMTASQPRVWRPEGVELCRSK